MRCLRMNKRKSALTKMYVNKRCSVAVFIRPAAGIQKDAEARKRLLLY